MWTSLSGWRRRKPSRVHRLLPAVLVALLSLPVPLSAQGYDRGPADEIYDDDDRGDGTRDGTRNERRSPDYDERAEPYEHDDPAYADRGSLKDDEDRGDTSHRDDRDGADLGEGDDAPDVAYFFAALDVYGRWLNHRVYGRVWQPRGVDDDWRPYTRGHWVDTNDFGWYWVSDEPFGWATYHYGRWHLDRRHGWIWVPGTRWGPAWVAWRASDDYVGWAPLPPDAHWEPRRGLVYRTEIYDSPVYEPYWFFVAPAYLSTPSIYRYAVRRDRIPWIIRHSRPRTNYGYVNRRIVNHGIASRDIERWTRRPVTRLRTFERRERGPDRWRDLDGDRVQIFRPDLSRRLATRRIEPAPGVAPPRPAWGMRQRPRFERWRDVDRRGIERPRVERPRERWRGIGRGDGHFGPNSRALRTLDLGSLGHAPRDAFGSQRGDRDVRRMPNRGVMAPPNVGRSHMVAGPDR